MPYINKKQAVISSILDKLIDEAPEQKYEPVKKRHQLLSELYKSVQRDLENLLNSRVSGITWPKEWNVLNTSLFAYGIPEFINNALASDYAQSNFCSELARIIQYFEPRFKTVQVKLLTSIDKHDRSIKMRIEGLLYVEPVPEPIVFNSVLEPTANVFLITDIFAN
jgi:type VI secretion system protein ImpF